MKNSNTNAVRVEKNTRCTFRCLFLFFVLEIFNRNRFRRSHALHLTKYLCIARRPEYNIVSVDEKRVYTVILSIIFLHDEWFFFLRFIMIMQLQQLSYIAFVVPSVVLHEGDERGRSAFSRCFLPDCALINKFSGRRGKKMALMRCITFTIYCKN